MSKIAIIENAIGLNGEKGYSRFRFLPKFLAENYGYDVELITSTFQHWEKKQRNVSETLKRQSIERYKTTLIPEPGYKKNVDLKRIYSHWVFADNVIKHLKKNKYDLIYCTIPDNRLTAKVAEYAHANRIKMIVDVEDLWPEAMQMAIHLPKLIDMVVYAPFRYYAKKAYTNADAFVGTSDEYRDVPLKKYKVKRSIAKTVYVGCDIDEFDNGVIENSDSIIKNDGEFWITYSGTLGASYDISTLIEAMAIVQKEYPNIRVKILGGGPDEQKLKELSRNLRANVDFVGYMPYPRMAAYLSKSDIVINSFVRKAPQSIVNKIGDYLSAGKPMINTCSSPELREKVKKDGTGCNVLAEDRDKLATLIKKMYKNPKKLQVMGENARRIAEAEFVRKESYKVIEQCISALLNDVR